ncbi:MAG: ABC transporter permease [Candidatus Zixiibacteriota bacterium]|nr:MAG: ABC transporter permease [candidate division Zixibacteria bacterium]
MLKILPRELGYSLLVMLTATVVIFVLVHSMPDGTLDTAAPAAGGSPPSLAAQYGHWLGSLLRADLGQSMNNGQPVRKTVQAYAGRTLLLTLCAMAVTLLLALPLGVGYALHERSRGWRALFTVLDALSSLPVFVVSYLVILVYVKTVMPAFGLDVPTNPETIDSPLMWVVVVILMALILGTADGTLSEMARCIRVEVRDLLDREFVLALRARGVSVGRHVARNALIPIFSLLASRMVFFLSGAVVIEIIFSYRGLGYLTFESVKHNDYPVIMGVCLALVLLVLASRLAGKLVTALASPYAS